MLPRTRFCALALFVAAGGCFTDQGLMSSSGVATASSTSMNAATDTGVAPTSSSGTATTLTGDSGVTADPTTSMTSTTSTSSTTSATSTEATSTEATTTPVECAQAGEPCDAGCCGCLYCGSGKCLPNNENCDSCLACTLTGDCTPAAKDTECSAPDPDCTEFLYGPQGPSCNAYKGAIGACDGNGGCEPITCGGAGDPVVSCKSESCTIPDNCTPGDPVDGVGTFCVAEGKTPLCNDTCEDLPDDSGIFHASCELGTCIVFGSPTSCNGFKCGGPMTCKATCVSDADCTAGYGCKNTLCAPL